MSIVGRAIKLPPRCADCGLRTFWSDVNDAQYGCWVCGDPCRPFYPGNAAHRRLTKEREQVILVAALKPGTASS